MTRRRQPIHHDDLRRERSCRETVYFFFFFFFSAKLPWKQLFCPLPSCLAFLHTMRRRANCLFSRKIKQIGVVFGKRRGLKSRPAERRTRAEETKPQKAQRSRNRWSLFTRWSFCFLGAACYLISGRQILSRTPSSPEPDRVFKEERNNKHPLRLDVCRSTKPQSAAVRLPPL